MKTIRIKLNNTIVLLLSLSFCYSACSISDVSQNIETTIHGQIHEFHDSVEEFENEQKSSNPHQNESERNAYLSITGSYVDENGVLSESYCIYDLESGLLDEYYHVPATSSYPCCVCDMRNQIVYYSAAVPEEIEGHAFMSENVYAYNIDDGVIKQITDYGSFMNRMILTEERLYFCGGRRSMIGVEVGYIDLQTGEVVILDCYKDIKGLNVRDISYNYNLDELTLSWYSETEQNELNQIYYQEIEEIGNSALHQLAPSTLDQIDMKTGDIRTLAIFNDCRPNGEYCDWTVEVFKGIDNILKPNGCVLYNMSYSSENTEVMYLAIAAILQRTNFTIAGDIVWKKTSASLISACLNS